ncbi:MAG: PQQ-binding-like beta-propeller repeat protein [Pirellulales bacterium]|nr:PQQ-binding-like beta-propeller repeat protein [Pirellulales bacterium]
MQLSKVLIVWFLLGAISSARSEDWPCWRGPRGDGSSRQQGLPVAWDGPAGKNILWKTAIPGRGLGSPIVSGGRVFLASCLKDQRERLLLCLNPADGRILWKQGVFQAPLERIHPLNSYASSTPAADAEQVYASFLEPDTDVPLPDTEDGQQQGTPGNLLVTAYDFTGRQRWLVRPGRFCSLHGYCCSIVLFEDLVILNADQDDEAYLLALDRRSGKTVWKTKRTHNVRSYCTPLLRTLDGRPQLLLSGAKTVSGYDARRGTLLWELTDGVTDEYVASPVYNGRLLFVTGGYPEIHVLAVRPGGEGAETKPALVWKSKKNYAYVPSPILGGGGKYLLVAADGGVVSCFQADDGKLLWKKKLGKHYTASPIEADGLLYFLAENGITKIVRPGKKLEIIAENPLGENCYSSPAPYQDRILIRGEKHLYCIGLQQKP